MFTRGGAAKRIFKPTIPATRRSTRGVDKDGSDQNNSCNVTKSTPHGKVKGKDKDKEKSGRSKGKKELIQLDATFNGINITSSVKVEKAFVSSGGSGLNQIKDRSRSSQGDGSGFESDFKSVNGVHIKTEDDPESKLKNYEIDKKLKKCEDDDDEDDDVESIQKALYRDDFVSNNRSTNEDDLTPIGWEHVSQLELYKQKGCKKDVKPTTRFDKWACTKSQQDKMVLFQLPEMVLKGDDGRVGKIRIYKSGKMELFDTRSGVVYDLLHTDCDVNSQLADDNNSDEESDDDEVMKESQKKLKSSSPSTDWIKKEVEDDCANNQEFLPPLPSSSKSHPSLSRHNKTVHHNYSNKCDKDENEDDDDDDEDDDRNVTQSYREAVTFDGNQVVSLGPINKSDLLIGCPRLDKYFNL